MDILQEIKKNAVKHRQNIYESDWGLGQFPLSKIVTMVEIGKEFNLSFTFAKKVTTLDDEDWELRTMEASEEHLFVFPSDCRDKTEFWRAVEEEKKKPRKRSFVCEFCGIYSAPKPRCNQCEEEL